MFPRRSHDLYMTNVHVCKREQNGAARRMGDSVFVPCADNYRYAAAQRTTERQILKAWHTLTLRSIGFTSRHLSLKVRNSLKPWLLTQVEKTQSVPSVEVCEHPIAVIEEKAVFETHMVLWFCCSAGCEPAPSTEWDTGKWCLKEITETALLASIENTLVYHVSRAWRLQKSQSVKCTSRLSYLKLLQRRWESKLNMTAVTRNIAAKRKVGKLLLSYRMITSSWNHKT